MNKDLKEVNHHIRPQRTYSTLQIHTFEPACFEQMVQNPPLASHLCARVVSRVTRIDCLVTRVDSCGTRVDSCATRIDSRAAIVDF